MMSKMSHKTCRLAVAVTVATVLTPALPVIAVVTYDTRALSGDPAPGTTGGVYSTFAAPAIDDAGRTAFRAILLKGTGDVTSENDRGIWSEGSGSLSLVAREGSIAPGTTGVYNFLDRLILNGAGQTAFINHLITGTGGVTSANNGGIWSEGSGSLSLIAREGSAAPGTTGGVYSDLFDYRLNNAGQIAITSFLLVDTGDVTSANNEGIWSGDSGSLSLVARKGSAAPGTAGGVYSLLNNLSLNGAGQTAFLGTLLSGTGDVTSANDEGIWSEGSGSLSLVVREGSAAPGTAGGVYDSFPGNPDFNDAGQIVFKSFLLAGSGDVTSDNNSGIWSGDTGSLSLVARKGDAAPGTAGGVFSALNDNLVLNGAGQIAFSASLTGPGVTSDNDFGIWFGDPGSLSLVVREGDAAPGTDGVFRSFGATLNGAGQVAFLGILQTGTGGVTLANDRGIWATDPDGQLTLIVREGDLIDVNNDPLIDDFRTIRRVTQWPSRTGGEDGRGTYFNDAGQLAFRLTFTNDNSSGIFVATIRLPGDLDGDWFVGSDDLDIIAANWGQAVTPGDWSLGDPTGDGLVGIEDLRAVLSNLDAGMPPAALVIPEPASLALLGLGGLALTSRWRSPRAD